MPRGGGRFWGCGAGLAGRSQPRQPRSGPVSLPHAAWVAEEEEEEEEDGAETNAGSSVLVLQGSGDPRGCVCGPITNLCSSALFFGRPCPGIIGDVQVATSAISSMPACPERGTGVGWWLEHGRSPGCSPGGWEGEGCWRAASCLSRQPRGDSGAFPLLLPVPVSAFCSAAGSLGLCR